MATRVIEVRQPRLGLLAWKWPKIPIDCVQQTWKNWRGVMKLAEFLDEEDPEYW